MTEPSSDFYSFANLKAAGSTTTLAYILGLVDSPSNPVADLRKAKFILGYLYDVEEQASTPSALLATQSRALPAGYFPQTPVMLTKAWSPVSALLDKKLMPVALTRSPILPATASGIWEYTNLKPEPETHKGQTPPELFWSLFHEVCKRASERGLLISLIAAPGWLYEVPGRLPNWTPDEIRAVDRVIWRRTPVPAKAQC